MRTDRTFSDDEEDMATAARKAAEANSSGEIKHALISSRAADIAPEAVQWLWAGRLAIGKHTCIAGEPGTGKSQLAVAIIAAITTGGEWPCGEGRAPLGNVIILSAEDGAADTIVPRLIAASTLARTIYFGNREKGRSQ